MKPVNPVKVCIHQAKDKVNLKCTKCNHDLRQEDTVMVAEKQDEYQTLPMVFNQGGCVAVARYVLDDEELNILMRTRSIFLYQLNMKKPITPIFLSTSPDEVLMLPCEPAHGQYSEKGLKVCPYCEISLGV